MKRLCQAEEQIQWFDLPNHYIFHYIGSWEEKNDKDEDIVVIWGCSLQTVSIDFYREHPFYGKHIVDEITKITLNLATGKSTFKKFEPGFSGDFPVIP